ncbi:MAG TPA: hypothetical protein VM660_04240 [Bacillus sp. (in: firmicutes)]|nr:hypothetical protein [Bacillus sp. (in: firmicutes)]
MKRLIQFVTFVIMIIVVAGCNTSKGESQKATADMKIPDTIAYKDDFTRKYLNSKKEVIKGFYRFNSMTKGYTMQFPVNAKVSQEELALNSDVFESFRFNEVERKENLVYDYKITYENRPITSNVDLNLALLSRDVGYEGNYEQFDHEEKTYYYAKIVQKDKKVITYRYFSYIKSSQSDKAISYVMSFVETDSSENGKPKPEKLEEKFLNIIKSIDFSEQ